MTTAERRRRRRRGGSLRVPSDNVPRRTNPPVVAPVPEDPSLAMSIAYSFGNDTAETISRVDVHDGRNPVATEDRGSAPVSFEPEAPEAIPTVIDPPAMSPSMSAEGSDFEMKTREMSAVDLEALGLDEPGRDGETNNAVPQVEDNLPGMVEVRFKPQRLKRESEQSLRDTPPPDEERTSSVEVDMDGLEGLGEVLAGDSVPEEPTVIVVNAEEPPLPTPVPTPVPVVAATPRRERKERQKTVALTDDDLEGVREAVRQVTAAQAAEPLAAPPGPSSVLSDKARAELERVTRELESPGSAPNPVVAAVAAVTPSAPTSAPTPAPIKLEVDASINRTQPLTAIDIEVDKNEIESEEPLSVPDIDIHELAELAERTSSSGEYEVNINDEDEPAVAAAPWASEPAPPAPAPTPPQAAVVEVKRERTPAPSTPPPLAPVAPPVASTQPGVGVTAPPAPAPAPSPPKEGHAQPPAPPAAALAHPPPKTPPTPPPAPTAKKEAKPSPPPATRTTTTDGKMAPRGKPWFVDLFDEDYLRTLPFLTPQATQAEAEFVIDAMGLTPGAQVLDVGCGYGRHAMELAARGFHMVGLDLSTPLLVRGGEESQRRGLQINFVRGDMRELDFENQFDAAYCLFSTFGYFDDETNKKTIANIARALKPGGRVLIEILNRDYLITDLPTRVWWEGDGCVVLEEVELNYFSSRIQVNRSVVFDDGRQLEQEISVRAYSLHEVGKLMHAAGFRVLEVSGGYHTRSRFFGNQSRHIIVLAERKETAPS